MIDVPQTTNPTVQVIDSIIHSAIMDAALQATEKALEAQFPFLELPILHQVFDFAMKELFSQIDGIAEKVAAFSVIDAQTSAEAKAYQASVAELQAAIQKGDQNAIDQAQAAFEQAFGSAIHNDGS